MSTQDVSTDSTEPAIVMVATGTAPATLVLPPNAELGRRIAAAGATHEIDDDRMSRDHATVRFERGMWIVRDLDSRNGTYVDGERITTGEIRQRGDLTLRIGGTVFVLISDGRGHPVPTTGETITGPELARVHDQIRDHARGDTLLVQGEPGAGKEIAARLYHTSGPRSAGPFVAVNCAAIPDGVAERLLFGGTKGAIATIGHFQMARGGTLFLDEISELDRAAQLALERVLDAEHRDLGIVASGHELRAACTEKRMRDELLDKLARVAVQLPPLRARKVDIARLVQLEIGLAAERTQKPLAAHPKLVEACCLRFWPGNVRELRATVKHAAAAASDAGMDTVRPEHLPGAAGLVGGTSSGETAVERPKGAVFAIDRATLIAALQRANGVVSTAARALGVHRTQLYKLMEEHGVSHDDVT